MYDLRGYRMKICVIAGREFFHPFDQRLYKEMTTLKNAGFEVTLVTPDPESGSAKIDDIPVIKVSNAGRGPTATRMVQACKKVKCDVYHAHEFDGGYIGATLRLLTGRPVIYDVHDDVPGLIADMKNNPKLEGVYDTIERQIIKAMKGLVLAGESLEPRYKSLHKNTTVIHNYPMLEMFQCTRLEPNKALEPPVDKLAEKLDGKFVLGYVGGLAVRRGLLIMLEALHKLEEEKDIRLLLIGNFDRKADKKTAMEMIEEYNLKEKVLLEGWVEYRKLPAYIDLIDVGLVLIQPLTWLRDITPTKLFDFMACGKPVIASELPGIAKLINETKCGILVEPENIDRLAETIKTLHDSPELCKKLGSDGYNAVRDKYNWEREGEKLLAFYNKHLGVKKGR
jgi:glycosyltransferase involved in cell wall biosynthesis